MISSYQAATLHMEKARSKTKGRPMKGAGWRLFQDGDEYVVEAHGEQVGRFLPDNTFMFSLTGDRAYRVAHTLSGTISRNLPFYWRRVGMKKYRVNHRSNVVYDKYGYVVEFEHDAPAPMVYNGLKFDLYTGKCLNYQPDFKRKVDTERRKDWLAASRAWKRKLKVAARIGVFDKLIADEKKNPTSWLDKPRWSQDEWLDILYKAIKTGDCNTDLLRMFVASETSTWDTPTSMQMYERIDKVVKNQSLGLRERFGVFEGEVDDKKFRI